MDQEHIDEFSAVRRTAFEGLRTGRYAGGAGASLCRLVALPAFDNAVAWEVRVQAGRAKPAEPCLFRACWRADVDLQAFASPVERLKHRQPYHPTVEVASVPINGAKLDRLLLQFRAIPVPLSAARFAVGTDGTSYHLELGDSFCNARITWWVELPDEWAALEPVIGELRDLFESSWANRTQVIG